MNFTVELTKTIVVVIEADDPTRALELAVNPDDDFDGAWEQAEPHAILLNQEAPQ